MNFGATIKKIRTDKNLTQKELSDGILTRSHLSQIETNNYFPSYDKFFLLLDRLNVVFEEFLFIQNDQKIQFKQQIRSKISEAANLNDIEKLKKFGHHSSRFTHKNRRYYLLSLYVNLQGINFIQYNTYGHRGNDSIGKSY